MVGAAAAMSGTSNSSQFQRLKVEDALSYLDQVQVQEKQFVIGSDKPASTGRYLNIHYYQLISREYTLIVMRAARIQTLLGQKKVS